MVTDTYWCTIVLALQVSELEAMRKKEEAHLKALQKEHEQLKKDQFKAAQALHALRQVRNAWLAYGAASQRVPALASEGATTGWRRPNTLHDRLYGHAPAFPTDCSAC